MVPLGPSEKVRNRPSPKKVRRIIVTLFSGLQDLIINSRKYGPGMKWTEDQNIDSREDIVGNDLYEFT